MNFTLQQFVAYEVFKRFHLYERLPFVIISTTCPDMSVAYFRLKGVAFPKFERFGWHHVVVGIYQYGLGVRVYDFLSKNNRVTFGGHYEGFIRSGFEQQLCPAFGAGKHIVVMLGFGTDAWNANEAEQVFQHFRLVLGDVFLYFHG